MSYLPSIRNGTVRRETSVLKLLGFEPNLKRGKQYCKEEKTWPVMDDHEKAELSRSSHEIIQKRPENCDNRKDLKKSHSEQRPSIEELILNDNESFSQKENFLYTFRAFQSLDMTSYNEYAITLSTGSLPSLTKKSNHHSNMRFIQIQNHNGHCAYKIILKSFRIGSNDCQNDQKVIIFDHHHCSYEFHLSLSTVLSIHIPYEEIYRPFLQKNKLCFYTSKDIIKLNQALEVHQLPSLIYVTMNIGDDDTVKKFQKYVWPILLYNSR
jgi:hypothetical protein